VRQDDGPTRQRIEAMLGGKEGSKVTRRTERSSLPMVVQPRGVRRVSGPVEETLMALEKAEVSGVEGATGHERSSKK
jgi:ABC-type sugar transport system ATPase subunit